MKTFKTARNAIQQLENDRSQLLNSFLKKGNSEDFLLHHTALMDQYFIDSFEKSTVGPKMHFHKKPFAMIALGGYGRQELCLNSDIDILLLFKKSVPSESEGLIREAIYPLWDAGFEVGHATRSVKECIRMASEDISIFTSLLDARFLCGMSPLYAELRERMNHIVTGKRGKKLTAHLAGENRERHERFGDSSYLLEPNLKEGQGGLRDYHTILWTARITSKIVHPRDLEYNGHLSHDEYIRLQKALTFIWNVRNRLHYLTGRKSDQLFFEYQTKIARILSYKSASGQMTVECFLGTLHKHMEYIKQTNLTFLMEAGYRRNFKIRRRGSAPQTTLHGLEVNRNMLGFASAEHILAFPHLLMKIFEESSRLKLPLSSEARRIVKEFVYLVDKDFRSDPLNVKTFERILVTPADTFDILNEMLNTGVLAKFIPGMKAVADRIQYNGYHIYPIDKHLLNTVKTIKTFSFPGQPDDLNAQLYKEMGRQKKILLWAALLHDIGKGEDVPDHPRRGSEAACEILKEFGYSDPFTDTVSFLIAEHLLLVKTATRRDLNEEETALFCARRIKESKRLKLLYLLTVADAVATGPKAWNEWISTLVRDLFFKVLKIIETQLPVSLKMAETVEKRKRSLLRDVRAADETDDLAEHLDRLSHRYIQYASDTAIMEHWRLFRKLQHNLFVWKVDTPDKRSLNVRTVTICAKDHPGLFSKIAGVLTLNRIDILKADVFTWENGIALDIFTVRPPPDLIYEDERWEKTKTDMTNALHGELNLSGAMGPQTCDSQKRLSFTPPRRIEIDNQSSSFFTIVEVFASEFPGLLFHVTNALFKQRLDVKSARIATKIDQVVAVFYVRNIEGQKVETAEKIENIRNAIHSALNFPPGNRRGNGTGDS